MDEEPAIPAGRADALTDEQEQAVARRAEPLLVSAAAGSGKTSVLVERFVRAVREDATAPGKILAITFTERAAGELRARVRSRLLELGDREAARDTEAAFVGTFHGFCARLLRTHPLAAGLDPEFAILDEGLAGRLRQGAFKAALQEFLATERADAVDLIAAYGVDRVEAMIQQVHRELRSRGQRLPRLPLPTLVPGADALELEAAAACGLLDELLERFGRAYERLKGARAGVDFDDLELLARALLDEREDVRLAWSERFELLMVDEFQDTNPRQLGILRALDRGNLFTVGDEHQSIYGFRHADVSLFRARRAELAPSGGSLALTQNFRSDEALLEVINAVFAERLGAYTPLVPGRRRQAGAGVGAPAADPASGTAPVVELLLTNTRGWEEHEDLARAVAAGLPHTQLWRQAEARLLAQRVAELVRDGQTRAGDVVVLLRASGDLEVFERALQLRGLRTLAAVGAFWGHQQIGDLISYLRALANPLDEAALYGALASPLGGCSRDCLALLAETAHAARRGVWETALAALAGEGKLAERLSGGDLEALRGFCVRLQGERANASRWTIAELIERVVASSGYREHVLALDWGERRLANIHKLLRLARRFEAREGRDLRAFLDHVEYLRDTIKVEPDAPVDGVEPDAVRLMTIHAAKGLEFPVVCVADLGRQIKIQAPALIVDGERIGIRLTRLDGATGSPALDYEELSLARRQREAEEEDRILYVAMTRARERLLLSGSVDFQRWPSAGQSAISWLGPAIAEDLPARVAACQPLADLPIGASGAVSVRSRLNSPETVGEVLLLDTSGSADGSPPLESGAPAEPAEPAEPAAPRKPTEPAEPAVLAPGGAELPVETSSPAPSDRVGAIAALSYTSLSALERCGYRYYLERVLGLGEDRSAIPAQPAGDGLQARTRGTLIHSLLESLDFAHESPPSAEEVGRRARELGMRTSTHERDEVAALIAALYGSAPAVRVARADSLRRELPFAFSLGADQPLVTGVIDLLAHEADGGLLVLDYKSDRVDADTDLGALVEREYGLQRLLYALAVLRDGALSVEIVHWFLQRPQEPVGARFTAAERTGLEERFSERLRRARAGGYAVSQRPHRGLCQTCPGRSSLCSWGEQETMRELPTSAAPAADAAASRS
jgi:ATP-dependent helicase/nuclease subunit A